MLPGAATTPPADRPPQQVQVSRVRDVPVALLALLTLLEPDCRKAAVLVTRGLARALSAHIHAAQRDV
eukprot:2359131-Alexandrium_andersonii.AAC.1